MKVAIIGTRLDRLDSPRGGVTSAVANLIEPLSRHGLDITVFSLQADDRADMRTLSPGRAGRIGRFRRASNALTELIADEGFDLVHVHGPSELVGSGAKRVLTVHGMPFEDVKLAGKSLSTAKSAVRARTFRSGLQRHDAIISISSYTDTLLRSVGVEPAARIGNPVAQRFTEVRQQPANERTLLIIGRVSRLKNQLGAVRALAPSLRSGEFELRLAGPIDQSVRAEIELTMSTSRLNENAVTFLGPLDQGRIAEEIATAAVIVLPSLQENSPISILEALAVGAPVVATPSGAVSDLLADGRGHVVTDVRSELVTMVRDAIKKNNDETIDRRRAWAHSVAAPDVVAASTARVYATLTDG